MGTKLLWLGMTIMLAVPKFISLPAAEIVGAIIMVIGCILLMIDR